MELRAGYKQTEVGLIPEDWDDARLGAVCALVNGRGFKPHEWGRFGYPIIRIQNLNGSDDFNYFSGRFDPKLIIEYGQLLFAWSGSRGTSFGPHIWRGQTALLNYHTWKVITFDKGVDAQFFFHALHQLTKTIEDAAHGASALVHTQKREMENYLVPVPRSLDEQRAIAAALSDADALIAALDALIAKKRDLKQATMQQLLTGKTRLPGFALGSEHKDTEVGLLPEDWDVARIVDVASITTGSRNTQDRIDDGAYPFFVRSQTVERINSYSFDGEAVLTAGDGVGTGKIFHYINGKFDLHQRVYKISNFSDRLIGHYFFLYFSDKFFDRIMSMTAKSSVDSVRLEMIADMLIPLPSRNEQVAIAAVLEDMDRELAALEGQRDKVHALKQGMMQELLTGRIRVV